MAAETTLSFRAACGKLGPAGVSARPGFSSGWVSPDGGARALGPDDSRALIARLAGDMP